MNLKRYLPLFIVIISCFFSAYGQDVTLYQQFNGRYDFTFIGNTMNLAENNIVHDEPFSCVINTNSTATLTLNPTDVVEKAFLYWAGSGEGDFDVELNGQPITAERTFSLIQSQSGLPFFSAFKDITDQVLATGNGDYTLSELDLTDIIPAYCPNATNFAGWAVVIVYKNDLLPLNQINVYDGLQGVPDDMVITLSSLNVLDNNNSKVGFIAWEGDSILPTEEFLFNNTPLSNGTNPENNVFNGTNSITGSNELYNMDLDIYNIEDYIHVGDPSAQITLSSSQDFIMINTVVTKLNSQLPDATIVIDSFEKTCDSKTVVVHYTVSNLNATNPLPANTPISLYVGGILQLTVATTAAIPIDGSLSGEVTLVLPDTVVADFDIKAIVDDTGNGTGIVTELNEANNATRLGDTLWFSPTFNPLETLVSCNEGFTRATFDFSVYEESVKTNPEDTAAFYETMEDAANGINPIVNASNYIAVTTPKQIFIKISNENCSAITYFFLTTRNCPPTVYNYISVNNDAYNENFFIDGLRNIFLNYKIEIYNRWGRLVWTGNQDVENWNGYVKEGFDETKASDGTYFYLLFLNDVDYPEPLKGFLYINH